MEFLSFALDERAVAGVLFIVVFAALLALPRVARARLRALSQKTDTSIDDLAVAALGSLSPAFSFVLAFFVALRTLTLSPAAAKAAIVVVLFAVVWQAARTLGVVVNTIIERRRETDGAHPGAARFLGVVAQIAVWTLGGLLILQNAGVEVASLIAGLGIGGIAVAFALQNILGDLFSSFAIFFDKPFEVGDTIQFGEHTGTVKRIGIKTTRVRSVEGEEIIVANRELTTAVIHNYKRLEERRRTIAFGVAYETPRDALARIPALVKRIIDETDGARFVRAHLIAFGDSSLDFEVAYYVESDDYTDALDAHQRIMLALHEVFARERIEFAYPVRVVRTIPNA